MKIGFIGLGIMGSRMAANLQKCGHTLYVCNRTREKADPLVMAGAHLAASPASLASQVQVIFTMLAHPGAVEEAALGRKGFLSHSGQNAIWIDYSTVNPSFSRSMALAAQALVNDPASHAFQQRPERFQVGGLAPHPKSKFCEFRLPL